MVTIAAQPALTLYFQDRRLSLDEFGAALANLPEKDRALVVNADREVPYDVVMRVTNEGLKRGLNVVLATSQPPR